MALALTFKTKLRELEKILVHINAVRKNCTNKGGFHLFWGAYLVFLKDDAPSLYYMALRDDAHVAMQEIKSRYEGQILYFGDSNVSVHDVYMNYLNLYRGGKESARKLLNGGASIHDYTHRVATDFYSEFDAMKEYAALVDLAHRIE